MENDHGSSQAYGKGFARVYNSHWTFFSERVAPVLLTFFGRDSRMNDAPRSLLDVCCGTGQLATHFLSHGYRVTGIDLSPYMLEHAKGNNRRAIEEGRATFLLGDASAFTLDERHSFAVSLFDALNHLPDLDALSSCFHCVWNALSAPGLFLFDLNTRVSFDSWNGITVQDSEEFTLIDRGSFAKGDDRAFAFLTGFLRNANGSYERFTERVYETVFDTEKVLAALEETGFRECYAASEADLSSPVASPEALPRAFFVGRKG